MRAAFLPITAAGLSLTTLATAFLFGIGSAYYSGFWSHFGMSARDVSIPMVQLLSPPIESCVFVASTFINYVAAEYVFWPRRRARALPREDQLPGAAERAFGVVVALLSVVLIAKVISEWGVIGVFTILGSFVCAVLLFLSRRMTRIDWRYAALVFAVSLSLIHAYFVGKRVAPSGVPAIALQVVGEKEARECSLLMENSDGIYVRDRFRGEKDGDWVVRYFPRSVVHSFSFADPSVTPKR